MHKNYEDLPSSEGEQEDKPLGLGFDPESAEPEPETKPPETKSEIEPEIKKEIKEATEPHKKAEKKPEETREERKKEILERYQRRIKELEKVREEVIHKVGGIGVYLLTKDAIEYDRQMAKERGEKEVEYPVAEGNREEHIEAVKYGGGSAWGKRLVKTLTDKYKEMAQERDEALAKLEGEERSKSKPESEPKQEDIYKKIGGI